MLPTMSCCSRQAWLKKVSESRPVPSVMTASRMLPLRFCIFLRLTCATRATIVTSSPGRRLASGVSSPRWA